MESNLKKDKISLISINTLMQMIFVFYGIFFSIYVYSFSGNINLVLACNLFQIVCCLLIQFLITPLLNKKSYNIFYRISFILILISILLVFTIKTETFYMVFIVEFFYSFSLISYYVPHEINIMNKNNSAEMKTFLGLSTSISMISSFLAPFISGYVIDYVSYFWLFIIIIILAVICFIISFFISNNYVDTPKIKIQTFFKQAVSNKKLKYSYLAFGLYKVSQDSAILVLLPILLYMQVQTNFYVGLYSALASFVGAVILLLYVKFIKKKDITFIVCSSMIVLPAILLVFMPNIIVFSIYYFASKIFSQILLNGVNENTFSVTKGTSFENYKKEHHLVFSAFNYIFQILGFGLAFLVYNLLKNTLGITIIILILNLLIFLSNYFLIKSYRLKSESNYVLDSNKQN